MGHLKYNQTTKAEMTSPEWLPVGAQIGELARTMALRGDLVAYVGPGAGGIAPACYIPATAEIEVNAEVAFGHAVTPEDIGDLRERTTQFEWPKATGAIFHEALHARYSQYSIPQAHKDLGEEAFHALLILEEGRIERLGTLYNPENAGFLRACALEIVLSDIDADSDEFKTQTKTQMAATLAALSLARVDAGVLEDDDVLLLRETIASKLGEDTLAKLRELWTAAQAHEIHHDATGLYDIAREWVRVVNERAVENGEDPEAGEGDGPGSGGFLGELLEALDGAAASAAIGAFEQLSDQQTAEEGAQIAQDKQSAAKQEKEHKDIASDVFGKGTGPMPDAPTRSSLRESRAPRGEERAAAVKVGQMLEKAKYRERDETEIHSMLPPGRLRTRALVQGAALKAKGVMAQAEPWRRTMRKHVDDPTLNIGVMVDISGSMGSAMEPMATTAWVLSEAVRRVQGRAAMVYYGQSVFPTLKPGQHLKNVDVYTAPDATEKFDTAFKALNGAMNLLNGNGARLLVVVSDGAYTGAERMAATRWLEQCGRNGVGVLWLTFDNGEDARRVVAGTPAVLLTGITSPTSIAMEIGTAAAKALTAVS